MNILKLHNSVNSLNKLTSLEMEVKKAYELRKFIIALEEKLKPFNILREDLIKKYWEKKWNWIQVKEENLEKFSKEINEIGKKEVKIKIPNITIDDIEWKMSTNDLIILDFLIK